MASDRIFGLVVILVALGYGLSATQIQTSFLADPVGPRLFPYMVAGIALLCGLSLFLKPDPEPDWPASRSFLAMGVTVVVLVAYAYTLKPLGFLIPTAIAATILSYQITPRVQQSVLAGVGLSVGLFILFKFALGLGLVPFPKGLIG